MNHMKLFIGLFFFITTFSYAQNCTCESNYQWVKKTFEENDAGFQFAIDRKGLSAYKAHNDEFAVQIKNMKSDLECTQTIYDWMKFFRKDHFAITINETADNLVASEVQQAENPKNWEKVKIDLKKFEKYINAKKEADPVGIWETSPYVIALKKFGDQYKGFIVSAKGVDNWKPEDVKFNFSAYFKSGSYY